MTKIYGHKWTSSFGDDIDPMNIWAACLKGLVMSDIKAGFNRMLDSDFSWPPSAIEFRKLCLNKETIASGEAFASFLNALSKHDYVDWKEYHPALYWCYKEIGSFNCRGMSTDKLESRFKDLWPYAMKLYNRDEIKSHDTIAIEDNSVEEDEEVLLSDEEQLEMINNLKKVIFGHD